MAGLAGMQACEAGPWSSCGARAAAAPRCRPVLVSQPDVLVKCAEGAADLATMLTCGVGPSSYWWPGPGAADACAAVLCGAWTLNSPCGWAPTVAVGLSP